MKKQKCSICSGITGLLEIKSNAHYMCLARKDAGLDTPNLDYAPPTQVLGVNCFISDLWDEHYKNQKGII